MRTYFLILLIFCVVLTGRVFGQEDWTKRCAESPRTVLAEAEAMYDKAVKENDSPHILQALLLQLRCKMQIDKQLFPAFIKELEGITAGCRNVADRSILHSILAEAYLVYYREEGYRIHQRTPIVGEVPEDMEEWSSQLFIHKVFTHALLSTEPAKELQAIDLNLYRAILVDEEAPQRLRPTLYDFLCHRSIDLIQIRDIDRVFPQVPLRDAGILEELQRFLAWNVPKLPYNIESQTLHTYQDLLRFRQQDTNKAALLMADLDRLEYGQGVLRHDSVYLTRLQELTKRFYDLPYSVEVVSRKVQLYISLAEQSSSDSLKLAYRTRALQICEDEIKRFPDYPRISLLKQVVAELKAPQLSVQLPAAAVPGTDLKLQFTSRNTESVKVELFKIDELTFDYYNLLNENKPIKKHAVVTRKVELSTGLLSRDTVISVPMAKSGLYEVKVTRGDNEVRSDILVCSHLHVSTQLLPDLTVRFIVRDKVSGKPVKDAQVRLYSVTKERKYVEEEVWPTNSLGIASCKKPRNYNFFYEVTNALNRNGERRQMVNSLFREREEESGLSLFTDRKVYRPGQTVYYNGIEWEATEDSSRCIANKKQIISFYDANYQEIGTHHTVSNEWGSFSGSFVIPQRTLNGNFLLRCGQSSTYIEVAEYKRPKFEIVFLPLTEAYCFGSDICMSGQVKNYSGIFPPNSKVTYQVNLLSMASWRHESSMVTEGVTKTDADGFFGIDFRSVMPKMPQGRIRRGYYYEVKASVTDSKGESQETTTRININSSPYQLTTDIPENINKNTKPVFRVKAINSSNYTLSEEISYTISQLAPLSSIDQTYRTDSAVVVKQVLVGRMNSMKDSLCPDFSSWSSGAYLFSAVGEGVNGVKVEEKRIFFLYSPSDKQAPVKTYDWFLCEKTECMPGEETAILFGTGARDVYALYEIHANGKVVEQKQFKFSDELVRITIPYKKEYGEYICVHLSFVKNQQSFNNSVIIKNVRKDKKLAFQTKVFRDKLVPGQQETWEFLLHTPQGTPALAEVMAVMYDKSLDQIQSNTWAFEPIFTPFYGCASWSSPGLYNDYMTFNSFSQRFKTVPLKFDYLNFYSHGRIYSGFDMDAVSSTEYGSEMKESKGIIANSRGMAMMQKTADAGATMPLAGAGKQEEKPEFSIRQNFNETAFFYPRLLTNEEGVVKIQFQVPEATTRWKFMVLAHTRNLEYGQYEREVTTMKELQIAPNVPRFFRSGDSNILKATISNLSDSTQQGTAVLELFSPMTDEVLVKREAAFDLVKGGTATVNFNFEVPQDIDVLGCRVYAATSTFSDGEQHLVAVVPDRIMVTETLPIYASKPGEHVFKMPDNRSASKEDYRLTLELTANPIWYAVFALPALAEPKSDNIQDIASSFYVNAVSAGIARANPKITAAIRNWAVQHDNPTLMSKLEQNQELKSILTAVSPWVTEAKSETEQIQSLSQLFDVNRLAYLQREAIDKLQKQQHEDGSWSWFKGMKGDRFMTMQVVSLLKRAGLTGQYDQGESEKMMQYKALRFLDNEIKSDFDKKTDDLSSWHLMYLYVRSMFLDVPLGDALTAHKYFIAKAEEQWLTQSLYDRAIIATTLMRYGKKEAAERIVRSLKEFATITPAMGMYWANQSSRSNLTNTIMTQTVAMEAFRETGAPTADIDLMKQWLLRQKQTQNWGSTPATVDAVYALLLTGTPQLDAQENLTVAVGKQEVKSLDINSILGYQKTVWSAPEIRKDMLTVKVTKKQQTPTWGGLYLQYFDKLSAIRKNKSEGVNIEKRLFVENNSATGKELLPISKGKVKVGDKVIVRLTVKLERNMQYLHIKDLRAACFEPMNESSGCKWRGGVAYYEEIKDVVTNFFFDYISKGTYVFEYPVWVNQAGVYMDGIATLQSVYAPEFSSHSVAEWVDAE